MTEPRPRPNSRRRVLALLVGLALAALVLALVLRDWSSPKCDEASLQRAVVDLEHTPYPLRPVRAAQAIIGACPRPDSEMVVSHLGFLARLDQPLPAIYPASFDDPAFAALWREVCPRGPALALLGEPGPARDRLHETCDLDRLGILSPTEGRMVAPYTVRTWANYPWLRRSGVSHATARGLMRALLMWHGWSEVKHFPAGLELPRAVGVAPHQFGAGQDLFVHAGALTDLGGSTPVPLTEGWQRSFLDSWLLRQLDERVAIVADASTPGEQLLRIAALLQSQGRTPHLVVATGEPYQPHATLPIAVALAATGDAAVRVRGDDSVAALVPRITERLGLPCCGESAPPECPRACAHPFVELVPDGFTVP